MNTENMNWNRKAIEEKLKEQIRTIVSMVNAFNPQTDAALMAVALPNLVSFIHQELTTSYTEGFTAGVEKAGGDEELNTAIKQLARAFSLNHVTPQMETTANMLIVAKQESDRRNYVKLLEEKVRHLSALTQLTSTNEVK